MDAVKDTLTIKRKIDYAPLIEKLEFAANLRAGYGDSDSKHAQVQKEIRTACLEVAATLKTYAGQ